MQELLEKGARLTKEHAKVVEEFQRLSKELEELNRDPRLENSN